jgi:hypothetical protein
LPGSDECSASDVVGAHRPTFTLHSIDGAHILGIELKPHPDPPARIIVDKNRASAFECIA